MGSYSWYKRHADQTPNSNKVLVVKAFAKSVEKWKGLCSIEFNSLYDISRYLPASLVSVSTFSDIEEDHPDAFQLNIVQRCPNLESFRATNCMEDRVLVALANNCLKLRNLDINLMDYLDAENFDTGLIELIKKSPLTSFKSVEVLITRPVMKELLASQLQLQAVRFDIGNQVSRLQLSRFFKKFPALQSFDGGGYVSDKFLKMLLKVVTDNKFLRFFKVAFGAGNDRPQITLPQLNNFIAKCAHIDTVVIDLTSYTGLENDYLTVHKHLYPNVTLMPPA